MQHKAPVSNEGRGAGDEAQEVVAEGGGDTNRVDGFEFAGEVANLAGIWGLGVAGGVTDVVGVKVAARGVAVSGGINGVDVDVVR
jgi:hypothetical protein